ncbi:MAG: hypothetical protein NUV91_10205, partial [Candidatus Omnitrophica bacterium]|nr:hypothetical protein [Candidatus Omnitrophota bacterium]
MNIIKYIFKSRIFCLRQIFAGQILMAFLSTTILPPAYAQTAFSSFNLPQPGKMVFLSPVFEPLLLKGIKIFPENPFQFDFIIDRGEKGVDGENLQKESSKLIRYFLAALTIPEKNLWVNLSPYEKDRIIPEEFGQTEMGRDLLAQDYLLKQITASLIYPEKDLGKKFWGKIYRKAKEQYGTTTIPMNTFNKVWIVPEKAVVYTKENQAFVVEQKLEVMLEKDYLALAHQQVHAQDTSDINSSIIREIIIPELEREVNSGKNFSALRQIFHSMILATWYKRHLRESLIGKVYADQNKVNGVDLDDPKVKEQIYDQYLKAFKKGVYNYIKEEVDPATQQMIPRKYFSGGVNATLLATDTVFTELTQGDEVAIPPGSIENDRRYAVVSSTVNPVFQRMSDILGRVVARDYGNDWDTLFDDMERRQEAGDRDLVVNALDQLRLMGLTDTTVQTFADRVIVTAERERRLADEDHALGALIVQYRGQLKILIPRHRLQNITQEVLADLLHEVVEVTLLELEIQQEGSASRKRLDVETAHQYATLVGEAMEGANSLLEGIEAAKVALRQTKQSLEQGNFEVRDGEFVAGIIGAAKKTKKKTGQGGAPTAPAQADVSSARAKGSTAHTPRRWVIGVAAGALALGLWAGLTRDDQPAPGPAAKPAPLSAPLVQQDTIQSMEREFFTLLSGANHAQALQILNKKLTPAYNKQINALAEDKQTAKLKEILAQLNQNIFTSGYAVFHAEDSNGVISFILYGRKLNQDRFDLLSSRTAYERYNQTYAWAPGSSDSALLRIPVPGALESEILKVEFKPDIIPVLGDLMKRILDSKVSPQQFDSFLGKAEQIFRTYLKFRYKDDVPATKPETDYFVYMTDVIVRPYGYAIMANGNLGLFKTSRGIILAQVKKTERDQDGNTIHEGEVITTSDHSVQGHAIHDGSYSIVFEEGFQRSEEIYAKKIAKVISGASIDPIRRISYGFMRVSWGNLTPQARIVSSKKSTRIHEGDHQKRMRKAFGALFAQLDVHARGEKLTRQVQLLAKIYAKKSDSLNESLAYLHQIIHAENPWNSIGNWIEQGSSNKKELVSYFWSLVALTAIEMPAYEQMLSQIEQGNYEGALQRLSMINQNEFNALFAGAEKLLAKVENDARAKATQERRIKERAQRAYRILLKLWEHETQWDVTGEAEKPRVAPPMGAPQIGKRAWVKKGPDGRDMVERQADGRMILKVEQEGVVGETDVETRPVERGAILSDQDLKNTLNELIERQEAIDYERRRQLKEIVQQLATHALTLPQAPQLHILMPVNGRPVGDLEGYASYDEGIVALYQDLAFHPNQQFRAIAYFHELMEYAASPAVPEDQRLRLVLGWYPQDRKEGYVDIFIGSRRIGRIDTHEQDQGSLITKMVQEFLETHDPTHHNLLRGVLQNVLFGLSNDDPSPPKGRKTLTSEIQRLHQQNPITHKISVEVKDQLERIVDEKGRVPERVYRTSMMVWNHWETFNHPLSESELEDLLFRKMHLQYRDNNQLKAMLASLIRLGRWGEALYLLEEYRAFTGGFFSQETLEFEMTVPRQIFFYVVALLSDTPEETFQSLVVRYGNQAGFPEISLNRFFNLLKAAERLTQAENFESGFRRFLGELTLKNEWTPFAEADPEGILRETAIALLVQRQPLEISDTTATNHIIENLYIHRSGRLYFRKEQYSNVGDRYGGSSIGYHPERQSPVREAVATQIGTALGVNVADTIVDGDYTYSALSISTDPESLPQPTQLQAQATTLIFNVLIRKWDDDKDMIQRSPVGESFVVF